MISFAPDTGVWLLDTPRTSYALRIDETGAPCHLGWGPRLTLAEAEELTLPRPVPTSSFEGRPPPGRNFP